MDAEPAATISTYFRVCDGVRDPLPESERAARECVMLPLPSGMTAPEIDRVVAAVG